MKKLATVTPILFDGYLIISLHSDWIRLFGQVPTFVAELDDDGRMHLYSQGVVKK